MDDKEKRIFERIKDKTLKDKEKWNSLPLDERSMFALETDVLEKLFLIRYVEKYLETNKNSLANKRPIYFDSIVEQHLYDKCFPVKAYTERTKPTDVLNYVSNDRIERIDDNIVYIKGCD